MTPQPNKDRIRLLVDALRSGRFRQGFGRLATRKNFGQPVTGESKYCCLGVACEVAMANGLPLATKVTLYDNHLYDNISDLLPVSVRDWYGFDSVNPMLLTTHSRRTWWKFWKKPKSVFVTATRMNDDMGLPFHNIAAAFERTYLK